MEKVPVERAADEPQGRELLAAVFRALPDAALLTNFPERTLLDVNPALEQAFGHRRDELIGRTTEVLHLDRDHFDRFADRIRHALRQGATARLEWPFRRKDGSAFRAECVVAPLRAGNTMGVVAILRDLTEERRMRSELAASEARWRSLVETSPDHVFTVGRDLRISYLNHSAEGARVEDILGRSVFDFMAPEEVPATRTRYERVLATGDTLRDRMRVEIPEGHWRWYDTRLAPIREGDAITGVLVTTTEVTEQVAVEEEVRRQRDLAETLLQAQSDLGEGVAVVDMDGRLLHANAALANLTGHSLDELFASRNVVDILRPPQAAPQWAERARRLAAGEPVPARFESLVLHKAGHTVPVEIVGTDIRFRDAACRLVLVRDTTAAKRADARERLLDRLVETTDDAVVTGTPGGIITAWNPGAERLFGFEAAHILGKPITVFMPPDRAHEARKLARLIRGEAVEPYETERLRDDGTRIPVSVNLTALRDHDGKVFAVTAVLRDRRPQMQLEAARRELAHNEKLSALGSLVSGVAHELRTPLTYMHTTLHLLARRITGLRHAESHEARAAIERELATQLDTALEGVERINRLVDDLRRYTRLKEGERVIASLHEVVAEAADLFRATRRGEVDVQVDLLPTPRLPLDRVQLQQVVINLLENAADAKPVDDRILVETGVDEAGAAVLRVRDRGAGMPAAVAARAFDPFYTTKPQGTGLGLSIVRRIVESHGGRIECTSEVGQGTTFTIRLPPS